MGAPKQYRPTPRAVLADITRTRENGEPIPSSARRRASKARKRLTGRDHRYLILGNSDRGGRLPRELEGYISALDAIAEMEYRLERELVKTNIKSKSSRGNIHN